MPAARSFDAGILFFVVYLW